MQELKTKEAVRFEESTEKNVRVFLHASYYELKGTWYWELEAEAVFVSDVMFSFPAGFVGTKAIFHPDDLSAIKEQLATEDTLPAISFRIITTYGEVKTLAGENITVSCSEPATDAVETEAMKAVVQELEQKAATQHLRLLKEVGSRSSGVAATGTWYYNAATAQTWYADYVFNLHGLPAQSLNAHLRTFHPFIHPEDAELAAEFMDKAFAERAPLHIDYRISVGDRIKWVGYRSHWFFSERGEEILGGIFQDITEQKSAERELHTYKAFVQFQRQQLQYDEQQVGFGHWQLNLLTRKATYSDQYYRIFGLKPQLSAQHVATFLQNIHPDDRARVEALNKKIIYEHQAPDTEYRIVRTDGKIRHVVQKAKLLTYEGELIFSGVLQDITVQRMLETKGATLQETIWKQNALAQQVDEMASVFSWIYDPEDGSYTWSDSFYRFVGFPKNHPANITEKTVFSLVHPQDVGDFQAYWKKAAQKGEPASFGFRLMQRGALSYMKAVFNHHTFNEKTYFIGTVRDATAEHILQQQLSQRVQLAESLTENIADRVMITDVNNTVLLWNAASEKAYGKKKTDAVGENFFDLFPYLKTEEEIQVFQRVLRGERVVRQALSSLTGNGYYNLYLIPLFTNNEVSGILHVVHDVTGEVELRKNLNDRLQLIESIVQSSVDRIIALDRNLNYLYWNKKAEAYYGLSKEEVIGKNILEVFPQLVNDPSYGEIRRALRGETVYLPANPEQEKYFETYLVPIKTNKGEVTSLLWMAHDRTNEIQAQAKHQKAQQQLAGEHRRLKEAQAIGHVGSFEWTVGSTLSHWSDELYRINGLEPHSEDITLDKADQFVHPEDWPGLQALKEESMAKPGSYQLVHRIVRRDGEVRWVNHGWESFAGENNKVVRVTGMVQDITEQKIAEEQIKAQAHYLQRIQETVPDMISIMELPSKKVHYLNEETFAAHGFSPNEMLAKSREEMINIVHKEDRASLAAYTKSLAMASDEETITAKYRARDSRGHWKWFFVRGRVFQRDENGSVTQILNVIEDITQREVTQQELIRLKDQLAQKATDKYLTLFNSIDEAVVWCELIWDNAGKAVDFRLLELNPAYEKITGIPADASRGKSAKEIIPTVDNWWVETYAQMVLEGEPIRFEHKIDEIDRWFSVYAAPIGDKNEGQFVLVYDDITERKKADEALRESEERFRSLVQATSDTVYKMSADWKVMYNLEGKNFLDDTEGADSSWMEKYIPVHERARVTAAIEQAIQHKQLFELEHQVFDAEGNLAWGYSRAVPKLDDNGEITEWVGVASNTTLRKQAEEQLRDFNHVLQQQVEEQTRDLRESADFVEKVTQSIPDLITIHDAATVEILYTNTKRFWKNLYQDNEIYRAADEKRALSFLHPDEKARFKTFLQDRTKISDNEELAVEVRLQGDKWIRVRSKVFKRHEQGGASQMISFVSDITATKKAELDVQKNLSILQQAEELVQMGSWEYDVASGAFTWSEGMYRMFDLPPAYKVRPEIYLDFTIEEDRSVAKRILKNIKKAHQSFEETIRIKRGDEVRLLKLKGTVVPDENGRLQRVVGVDRDITDIRQAEEKVKETQHWLKKTAEASPDAITVYDLVTKQPVYLNNCLANWVGISTDELIAMGIEGRLQLIHADDRLNLLHFNEKLKAAEDSQVLVIEYRLYRSNGSLRWIRNRSKVFQRDAAGRVTHILSILQDVTEEKAADRVMKTLHASLEKKAQELEIANEEITSFAFVASHDLREPLRKIQTYANLLLTSEKILSESGRTALEKLNGSVSRLNLLINDVLTLTKVHVENEKPVPTDMNQLLNDLKSEMQETWVGASIEAGPLPTVLGSRNQLFYLFKNLVSNGVKFQEKGRVPHIRIEAAKEGVYLKISVSDNGIGIHPDYHKKIFEIFRRLHGRTEYEGTGMGLAICKKIMEKHGGKITVESKEGQGAIFTCWFPVALLV